MTGKNMAENDTQSSSGESGSAVIQPQKIYAKDVSFETPNSPAIFQKGWEPALTVDLGQAVTRLGEDVYEVVLSLTATMKCGDATAYLAEVQQAGIFTIKGIEEEKLLHILNIYCPRTLYPYACSALTELVARGGFPQLMLAPVSFEAIYHQRQMEADSAGSTH
jgi:preprotein translocase subunit SecB